MAKSKCLRFRFYVAIVFIILLALPSFSTQDKDLVEHQIGQMVLVGFKGTSPQDKGVQQVARSIAEGKLGGVILCKHNIESPTQLKKLCDYLHQSSPDILFIAVDQEGGRVQRLKLANGFTDFPSHQKVAADKLTFDQAYEVYKQLALELKSYGINLNFAPVVDLRINENSRIIAQYERSFSSEPAVATNYARAFIKAHRDAGVLTTLKHWPVHGSAAEDSHLGMVDVTATWSDIEQLPYSSLIDSGDVDAVMTAHVFHRGFDEKFPATLSSTLIQRELRNRLGFDGVVFTDCLQMGAIKSLYDDNTEQAALLAIEAGADIMLSSNFDLNDADFVDRLLLKVRERMHENGEFLLSRLSESNQRILMLKKRLLVARGHDEL